MSKTSKVFTAARRAAKSKVGRKIGQTAADAAKRMGEESLKKLLQQDTLEGIASLGMAYASRAKTPIGADGLSLLPTALRDVAIPASASGDVTGSANAYVFRPPRKRPVAGAVQYSKLGKKLIEMTTSAGSQSSFAIDVLDMAPVSSNPTGNTKYSNMTVKAFFDFYQQSTLTSGESLRLQQTSVHLKNVTNELLLTNNAITTALVDIYEVVPKFDLGDTTYANDVRAQGYMCPRYAFYEGLNADTMEPEDSITMNKVNAKPSDSILFQRCWKVIKHVRVNLTGGSTHRHKSVICVNKTIPYQEMANNSSSGLKKAGYMSSYLLVTKGVPEAASQAVATDVTALCNMQCDYDAYIGEQSKVLVYDDAS